MNPMTAKIAAASGGGDENNGCDFVFSRPLLPGAYWVRVDGLSGPAVVIKDEVVRETSLVYSSHPAWPSDIQTIADTVGRVEWFLYPEQYLTNEQCNAAIAEVGIVVARVSK